MTLPELTTAGLGYKPHRLEPNYPGPEVVTTPSPAPPVVERHLESLTPGERLFRGIDRWRVGDAHRARLTALGLPHHRVHDSRHFYYAIRAIRAGTPVRARRAAARARRRRDGGEGLRPLRAAE